MRWSGCGVSVQIVCLDLEGVLIPEMWLEVARATGSSDLEVTTREISDYDELMRHRLAVLSRLGVTLHDIRQMTAHVRPLEGAQEFLSELRQACPFAILSDTFVQFLEPVMEPLGYPFLLCNRLVIDDGGMIVDYRLRQEDGKRKAVEHFREMNLLVTAVGDSFNDISMLRTAHRGILFRPSETVTRTHPDLEVCTDHAELLAGCIAPH